MIVINFNTFLFIHFLFFIDISHCENPLSKYPRKNPFTLSHSTCSNFEEVCVKKGDVQCDNLINTCQRSIKNIDFCIILKCPSSNYILPKQISDGLTLYVSGLDGDFNFYPKEGSNDRKLKGSIIDKSGKDMSKDFKFKWYFLKSNKDEYPINELADKVIISDGEISFWGMKNPQQVLTAQCFATNGITNLTSPSFSVDVNKAKQMSDGLTFYVSGLDGDFNFYPKEGSNDRKLKGSIIDKSGKDMSKDFKFKWYFLKSNKDEYPINELADKIIISDGEISFWGMKNPQQVLTAQCFATNGITNLTSPSFSVDVNKATAPRKFTKQELNLSPFTSLNLICTSDISPKGNITWTFIPRGKTEEQNIPKEAELLNFGNKVYQLKIKKPMRAEYDGIYVCKIENQYGIGGTKYDVKIKTKYKKLKF